VEQRQCKVCGGNIVCTLKRSNLYFFIDKDGCVARDDNPDYWEMSPIQFHCENDMEHDIEIEEEWKEKYEEKIYRLI
jgi:hypothetical protein